MRIACWPGSEYAVENDSGPQRGGAASHPKSRSRKLRSSPQSRSQRFAPSSPATALSPVVELALATGMRRGELLGLNVGRLDLDRGTLRVERSVEETKAGLG